MKKKLKKKALPSYNPGGPWPNYQQGYDYWATNGTFPKTIPQWPSPGMTPEQEELAKRRGNFQQYSAPTANLETARYKENTPPPGQEMEPITQEDLNAPKVSPALPQKSFSLNPYAMPVGLFNFALNTAGSLYNQKQQRETEQMNNFLSQQPETNYYNKRMLYGDKSMFAKYGGSLPKADLGMFLGIDPMSAPSSPGLSLPIERFLPPERSNPQFNSKPGVDLTDLDPSLTTFLQDFQTQFPGLKVSSGRDGKHMKGSRHYSGRAVDIGANSSSKEDYEAFKELIKNPALLKQYGIEDAIDEGDHIHIELPEAAYGGELDEYDNGGEGDPPKKETIVKTPNGDVSVKNLVSFDPKKIGEMCSPRNPDGCKTKHLVDYWNEGKKQYGNRKSRTFNIYQNDKDPLIERRRIFGDISTERPNDLMLSNYGHDIGEFTFPDYANYVPFDFPESSSRTELSEDQKRERVINSSSKKPTKPTETSTTSTSTTPSTETKPNTETTQKWFLIDGTGTKVLVDGKYMTNAEFEKLKADNPTVKYNQRPDSVGRTYTPPKLEVGGEIELSNEEIKYYTSLGYEFE